MAHLHKISKLRFLAAALALFVGVSCAPAPKSTPSFSFRTETREKKLILYIKNTGKAAAEQVGASVVIDDRTYYFKLGAPLGAGIEKFAALEPILPKIPGSYPVYVKLYYYLGERRFTQVFVDYLNFGSTAISEAECALADFTLQNQATISLKRAAGQKAQLFLPEEIRIAGSVEGPDTVEYRLQRARFELSSSYPVFAAVSSVESTGGSSLHKTRICRATVTAIETQHILIKWLTALAGLAALALILYFWFNRSNLRDKITAIFPVLFRFLNSASPTPAATPRNALAMIRLFCCGFFFFSGCAALIYEVLWVRILGLVFGNTTYAVTTVLAVYMAGLGIGGYLFGRFSDRWRRPLRAYGLLELGLGIYAAFTFVYEGAIEKSFVFFAQHLSDNDVFLVTVRFCLAALILLPPTLAMGGTLPVLVRFFSESETEVGERTGLLYGLNTAGAVAGTLLAGFILIPSSGLVAALVVAVVLNVAIGLLACASSEILFRGSVPERFAPVADPADTARRSPLVLSVSSSWLPLTLFITGALAMIYEVAWTHVFATVVGSSTYSFSSMLAVFLLGFAIGAAFYKRRLAKNPPNALELPLVLLALSLYCLATLPLYDEVNIWSVRVYALTLRSHGWFCFTQSILLSFFMLPPALGFGALFPLVAALYCREQERVGRDIGALYLANTTGNVVGSMLAGFGLISLFGINRSLLIAVVAGGLTAAILAVVYRRQSRSLFTALLALLALFAGFYPAARGGWDPHTMGTALIVYPEKFTDVTRNDILSALFDHGILFYREGSQSIISVHETIGSRYLNVNGKTDASTNIGGDMSTQYLLGHLPHMFNLGAKHTLIIGFGSGTSLAAALAHPVQQVDLAEIEPAVLQAAPRFSFINRRAYSDPRAKIIFNDARNYLLVSRNAYDVIASEPSNPWMAGVGNLYTREFYRLAKSHLAPGGVFCQWLQKYNLSPESFRMVVATIKSVFPQVTIWRSSIGDSLLIASDDKLFFDLAGAQQRYEKYPEVRSDLERIGIYGAAGLFAYFALGKEDVDSLAENAPINTDKQPRLEFSAPKTLHDNFAVWIDKILASYRSRDFRGLLRDPSLLTSRADYLADIALAYLGLNDVNSAVPSLESAKKINPDHPRVLLALGLLKQRNREIEEALKYFRAALEKAPNSPLLYGFLGAALVEAGRHQEALPILDRSPLYESAHWDFLKAKITALVSLNRLKEAVPLYRSLVAAQPYELNYRVYLARAIEFTEGREAAVKLLEKIRTEHPYFYPAYQELKKHYDAMGDKLDKSIEAYEALVRANPYQYQYWSDLISMYRAKGDEEKARHAIKQAKGTIPDFVDLLRLGLL